MDGHRGDRKAGGGRRGRVAPGPWRRRAGLVEGILVLHGARAAPRSFAGRGVRGLVGAAARRLQEALGAVAAAARAQRAVCGALDSGRGRGGGRRGGRGRGAARLRRRGGRAGDRGQAGEVVLARRLAPAGGGRGRGAGRGPRGCGGRAWGVRAWPGTLAPAVPSPGASHGDAETRGNGVAGLSWLQHPPAWMPHVTSRGDRAHANPRAPDCAATLPAILKARIAYNCPRPGVHPTGACGAG